VLTYGVDAERVEALRSAGARVEVVAATRSEVA
jgi:hypothetical protein